MHGSFACRAIEQRRTLRCWPAPCSTPPPPPPLVSRCPCCKFRTCASSSFALARMPLCSAARCITTVPSAHRRTSTETQPASFRKSRSPFPPSLRTHTSASMPQYAPRFINCSTLCNIYGARSHAGHLPNVDHISEILRALSAKPHDAAAPVPSSRPTSDTPMAVPLRVLEREPKLRSETEAVQMIC